MGQRILLIAGMVAVAGLASLGWALIGHLDLKKFRREYEMTEGTVSEVITTDSLHFYPRIRFKTLDNQRLHLKLRREEANVKAGDTLAIYYDLVNPADAHLAMHHSGSPIYLKVGIGGALLAFGLLVMGWLLQLRAKAQRLVAEGRKVKVELLRAEPVPQWAFTGLQPHRIVCAWTNPAIPAKPVILESQIIFGNPAEWLAEAQLFAYFDQIRPERYHVDLAWLPAKMRLV